MPRDRNTISPALRSILSNPSSTALERFDPWNTASRGHQRPEAPGTNSSEWKETRSQKLDRQFGDRTGGRNGDAERWEWLSKEEHTVLKRRQEGSADIRTLMGGVKKRRLEALPPNVKPQMTAFPEVEENENGAFSLKKHPVVTQKQKRRKQTYNLSEDKQRQTDDDVLTVPEPSPEVDSHKGQPSPCEPSGKGNIFANLTVYINGSMAPIISDHKLKHLLAANGAIVTPFLARRKVTHVILGRPNAVSDKAPGAGGGLAGGKLQREIQRVGGEGVKFVGVEWVLESIKAGCRLQEARFATLHMASNKQRSVIDMFQKA